MNDQDKVYKMSFLVFWASGFLLFLLLLAIFIVFASLADIELYFDVRFIVGMIIVLIFSSVLAFIIIAVNKVAISDEGIKYH